MEEYVKIEKKANGLATIEFFHPKHNSLPSHILSQLAETIAAAGEDDAIKLIVLKSGGDRTFCSGASFTELISINDLETGKKTLTLKQFEQKYSEELIELGVKYRDGNLWSKYLSLSTEEQNDPDLIAQMKMLDANVNVNWPLQHYKTVARYLLKDVDGVPATGGTNWQKYLTFHEAYFLP